MAGLATLPPKQHRSAAPRRSLWGVVRKYVNIFRVSLVERLAYRGDFLLGTVLRFLPVLTTILLWKAVYAGSANKQPAGFSERKMIAYLLLIHISRMFSSMPGLAAGIARDIREGTLKKYLVQPLDMIGYLLSYRAAHKVAYIATAGLPYAGLFWLYWDNFDLQRDPAVLAAYVLALLLGFLIGFFFETTLGMAGFWFLEVTSLLWVVNTLNFFISGQMFPLDLLPSFWARLLKALPFPYLAYFPAMIYLDMVPKDELVPRLAIGLGWVLALVLLARFLYARGLRRYSAYGG